MGSSWDQIARRLGAIRSEMNALRRERRADVCKRIEPLVEPERYEALPCFKLARDQMEGHGIFPLCEACERNGQRAMREAELRHQSGAALRALQAKYEADEKRKEPSDA